MYKKPTTVHSLVSTTSTHEREGKAVIQKSYQAESSNHQERCTTCIFTPNPNGKSCHNGSQIKLYLESKSSRIIRNAHLRFHVQSGASIANFPPLAYWFSKVEFIHRSTGVTIQTIHDDVFHMLVNQKEEDKKNDLDREYYQNECYSKITFGGLKKQANTSNYFYLPLKNTFLDNMLLDLFTIDSDIEIRLHCRNNIHANDDELKEVALIIDEINPDSLSQKHQVHNLNTSILSHTYLDTRHYTETRNMASDSTYYFDLDQFDKKANALLVCLKPKDSYLPDSYNLGEGTFDIVGVNGESIYGAGRPVVYDHHLNNKIRDQWDNDYFKKTNQLIIPFQNIKKGINGSMHGCFKFNQSKIKLKITTPEASTIPLQAVWTLNQVLDNTCAVSFEYKGKTSGVAWNANQASIIDALNSVLKDEGFEAIAGGSGTFSTNAQTIIHIATAHCNQKPKRSAFVSESVKLVIHSSSTTKIFSVLGGGFTSLDFDDRAKWSNTPIDVDVHIYMLYNKIIEQEGTKLRVLDMN